MINEDKFAGIKLTYTQKSQLLCKSKVKSTTNGILFDKSLTRWINVVIHWSCRSQNQNVNNKVIIDICYSPAARSVLGETVPDVLSIGRGRYSDFIASDLAFSFQELLLNCIAASHKSLKSEAIVVAKHEADNRVDSIVFENNKLADNIVYHSNTGRQEVRCKIRYYSVK